MPPRRTRVGVVGDHYVATHKRGFFSPKRSTNIGPRSMFPINMDVEGFDVLAENIEVLTSSEFLDDLRKKGDRTAEKMRDTIRTYASAGPPGPGVVSGAYRDSWQWKRIEGEDSSMGVGITSMAWWVGTESPYSHRLEFGFVGVDSLGRHYAQAPRPHVVRAVQEFADTIFQEWYDSLGEWVQDLKKKGKKK